MNKKIFAFAFASVLLFTAFFFGCTTDGRYEGEFCYALVDSQYRCIQMDSTLTEELCYSSFNGKVVYYCPKE